MIYILLAIILFALNNVLWKRNLQNTSTIFLIAYRALFTSVFASVFLMLTHNETILLTQPILKITLGSVFGVLGLFCMVTALKKVPLQWLGIYNLIGIMFTASYLFFFEEIVFKESFIAVFFIIVGFIFYLYHNKDTESTINDEQHFLLGMMTLSFSFSGLLHWKNLDNNTPVLLIIANQELLVFFSASLLTLYRNNLKSVVKQMKNKLSKVLIMAVVIFFALLFSYLGLNATNPLLSSILFLATPLLTILLGALLLKEKISIYNIIAICIIGIGAFILHSQSAT
jgi:drug/metabolite transporter (DMT)-like permease